MCDLTDSFQRHLGKDEVDYSIYYVLGHYHQWGNYFNLSFVHEDGSREKDFRDQEQHRRTDRLDHRPPDAQQWRVPNCDLSVGS